MRSDLFKLFESVIGLRVFWTRGVYTGALYIQSRVSSFCYRMARNTV